MSHDGLVGVGTVPRGIGVREAVEGFTISCLDGVEPCLLDREAEACVVEADECSDAREVEAARIEWDLGSFRCQGQILNWSMQVCHRAGHTEMVSDLPDVGMLKLSWCVRKQD
jgi:hypothetical protein